MEIRYTATALEHLQMFDGAVRQRILEKMHFYRIQKNPLTFAKRLTGYDAYRFRVGEYRVVCDRESNTLRVLAVFKRDDAYRGL